MLVSDCVAHFDVELIREEPAAERDGDEVLRERV
jgi:hypothetical protein